MKVLYEKTEGEGGGAEKKRAGQGSAEWEQDRTVLRHTQGIFSFGKVVTDELVVCSAQHMSNFFFRQVIEPTSVAHCCTARARDAARVLYGLYIQS